VRTEKKKIEGPREDVGPVQGSVLGEGPHHRHRSYGWAWQKIKKDLGRGKTRALRKADQDPRWELPGRNYRKGGGTTKRQAKLKSKKKERVERVGERKGPVMGLKKKKNVD